EGLEYIYFVGGEPLLIEPHLHFLKRLVDEGLAPQINIEYNTNLTIINSEILELWKSFRKVSLGVSLDGFGAVNDYIRYPSQFSDLEKNIKAVDSFGLKNLDMWIAPTIQIYNIFYLDLLLQWIVDSDFQFVKQRAWAPLFTSHILHRPHYLNIQILDQKSKEEADHHLEHCIDLLRNWKKQGWSEVSIEKTINGIEGIRTYLWKKDQSQYLEKFKNFSEKLDEMRGQSLSQSIPRLHQNIL
ncbi:MAG: radical SAM protein, partial [Bdellovibrionales bacterium]|nr:radical SAM protein [Bdellovibrionales bacterium]